MGVLVALPWIGALYAFAPRLPPEMIMRFTGRSRSTPSTASRSSTSSASSPAAPSCRPRPRVYIIPSMTLNAFATGTPDKAVVGITEGLLRA